MRYTLLFSLFIATATTTEGEPFADDLGTAIERCWNVGALSSEAQRISITIGFRLGTDGKPISDSIELRNTQGGDAATRQAFEAARRAILRCGAKGFPRLPGIEGSEVTIEAEFSRGQIQILAPPSPTVEL